MDHDLKQNMKHWGEPRIKLHIGWCVLCISTADTARDDRRRCRLPGAHAALLCRLDEHLVVLLQAEHADHDGGAAVSGGLLTVGSTAVLTAVMRVE